MKIGAKLGLGFGVLMVLIGVVALVGLLEVNDITEGYQTKVVPAEELSAESNEVGVELLQVRRREKDFLARKDMKYVDKINQHLDNVVGLTRDMQGLTSDPDVVSKLTRIESLAGDYRSGFKVLAAAVEERGLNEKLGVQGEFRSAVHQVEQAFKDNGFNLSLIHI